MGISCIKNVGVSRVDVGVWVVGIKSFIRLRARSSIQMYDSARMSSYHFRLLDEREKILCSIHKERRIGKWDEKE